jgi:ribosomal protein S18 acetylase RimI-like enzyme
VTDAPAADRPAALAVRPYQPSDAPALLSLLAVVETHPPSEEEFEAWEARRDPSHFSVRLLAEREGAVVGFVEVAQTGFSLPGMLEWDLRVHPQHRGQGVEDALADAVEEPVSQAAPVTVEARSPDEDPQARSWLEGRGFRLIAHRLESQLDLTTVDEAAYRAGIARAEEAGYAFPSLTEVLEKLGAEAAWERLVPLYQDLVNDTPDFVGRRMPESAVLARTRDFPYLNAAATTFVEKDGDLVGLTFVWRFPEEAYTVMTGIRAGIRQAGVGFAMKALAALRARDQGVTTMGTHNDASNAPVLALNGRLGYVRRGGIWRLHKQYSRQA